jgi:MOSC domain-containing protein YiiM
MGKILAVCISEQKKTKKKDIKESLILKSNGGLENDAHADPDSHRQVSLLALESIEKMRKQGLDVNAGDFAENLTTHGIDLKILEIGTLLGVGEEVLLEITQIGKECHTPCAIYHQVGNCVMPTEGIFCRVLESGTVRVGDGIKIKSDN